MGPVKEGTLVPCRGDTPICLVWYCTTRLVNNHYPQCSLQPFSAHTPQWLFGWSNDGCNIDTICFTCAQYVS